VRRSIDARSELHARLLERRPEIEQAAVARVYGVSDPTETFGPEYVEGLRAAVSAALDHGFAAIEHGEERSPPPPATLLVQARMAARNGVSLETVLRRYFAGYTLLGDFVMREATDGDLLQSSALQHALRALAALFDRLIAAVTEEYTREAKGRLDSAEERRAERVKRLLAGELLDTSGLQYDFGAHHLGAIAVGPGAGEAVRALAGDLDRRLLAVERRGEGALWAWLGGRRGLGPDDLERQVSTSWPAGVTLALGEPGQGLAGWRLTHRQARAALPIALRSPCNRIRYADVAMTASILQDDLLSTSLHELYLAPLEQERDGGEMLRQTLRAYFASGFHISSAAAALGTSRPTITKRLSAVEERLGRPLGMCRIELEAALRLDALGG